uniref:Uncharacterized protein n=1 Tax=Lactuca sativa TaxID=4236 RepID=A0A9R1WX24_LACSA|nr:hypothetical protein LSAT_V11C800389600 [Lactuca sativa]
MARCTKSSIKASQELKSTKHRLRNELGFSRVSSLVKQGNPRLTYGLNRVQSSNLGFHDEGSTPRIPLSMLDVIKITRDQMTHYPSVLGEYAPHTRPSPKRTSIGLNFFSLSSFQTNFISTKSIISIQHLEMNLEQLNAVEYLKFHILCRLLVKKTPIPCIVLLLTLVVDSRGVKKDNLGFIVVKLGRPDQQNENLSVVGFTPHKMYNYESNSETNDLYINKASYFIL